MDRIYKFNNSLVKIKFGNILNSELEVIVSSDDSMLSMGGGISNTICMHGGIEIKNDAIKKIPAKLGDVIVTTSGKLNFKFVFHAITIDIYSITNAYKDYHQVDIPEFIVKQSVKNCFKLLSALGLHSIAFPAIGAGCARISYDKVAICMSEAINEMLLKTNKSLEVELWLYDRFDKMSEIDFLPFFENFSSLEYFNKNNKTMKEINNEDFSEFQIESCDNLKSSTDHTIFISYSRKDINEVKSICKILKDLNIKYWIDLKGIYSGDNYKEVIVKAIKNADILIFVSSKNSNSSINVAKEIAIADCYKKAIIPIKIDSSSYAPQIEYDLNCIDSIDYNEKNEETIQKIKYTILGKLAIINSTKQINNRM